MLYGVLSDFGDVLADRTGLEPATSAVTGRHSNQLNYRSIPKFWDGKDRRFEGLAKKEFGLFWEAFYYSYECYLWQQKGKLCLRSAFLG